MRATMIDITRPVYHGMPVWPNDPCVRFSPALTIAGDGANVTEVCMGTHSGTHVDAPSHFLAGAGTADTIPLESLVGPCFVMEIASNEPIGHSTLQQRLPKPHPSRILLKTGLQSPEESPDAYLDAGGAAYLAEHGVVLIGTERMSIERPTGDGSVHGCLLEAGIVILEGVDLTHALPGEYNLTVLPLLLVGLDGAPCRAILTPLQSRL